ncbi:MAG: 8-amino-7-oxononanoate synthase [Candidatus Nitrotoga sp.]
MPFSTLHPTLNERAVTGLLRTRCTVESPSSPHIVIDGKSYLSFCSNDYLGLANHPQLISAMQQGAQQWGVGSGASHLVSGHTVAHQQMEIALAKFVGKPAALFFSSGYLANLGVVQALVGRGDTVFADKLNHASLNDAMLLSRAAIKRYRHNDVAHLALLLQQSAGTGRKLIVTDAVFSMDGDIAPLPELVGLCEQNDAWLLIDDAHGFGVLGKQGRGSVAHYFLNNPRIIYMATLGKAAGVSGAFVAAEQVVIDTLLQAARTYIYTTASPPALASTLIASLGLIEQDDWRRAQLQKLIAQLRAGLQSLPWKLLPSDTPIQPLVVGENNVVLKLSDALRGQGIWIPAIRPPTVPPGTARLRISLSAAHSDCDVARLITTLHELAR